MQILLQNSARSEHGHNMGIEILGTGSYLPETVITNDDFTKIVETSDEWIHKHSGIRERRFSTRPTYEMALEAAKCALESANCSPLELDLILCTTVTSDYHTPSLACFVQGILGAENAIAYDINAACAGFVFGVDAAKMYLANGYKRVLVISAENLTRLTDFTDRGSCVLFGDGAGAVILGHNEKPFSSFLGSDGTGASALFARRHEQEIPFVEIQRASHLDGFGDKNEGLIYMDGHRVYKFAVTAMPKAVRAVCEKHGITPNDLDLIIPHQANIRIIQTAVTALKFPMEKVFCNIEKYGNTSSACIPIALDEAVRQGRLKRGDKICLVGFGAGLVYGAVIFEY